MKNLFDQQLVAIDIEGDGNAPIEPVEITAIDFTQQGAGPARTWTCNPGRPMNRYAVKIHGITDAMVRGLPRFDAFAPEVFSALQGKIVISHGVAGDMHLLKRKIPALAGTKTLDTLKMARVSFPGRRGFKLFELIDELGIHVVAPAGARGRHSSALDAEATRLLFMTLVEDPAPGVIRYLRDSGYGLELSGTTPGPLA